MCYDDYEEVSTAARMIIENEYDNSFQNENYSLENEYDNSFQNENYSSENENLLDNNSSESEDEGLLEGNDAIILQEKQHSDEELLSNFDNVSLTGGNNTMRNM
jgi:hypothetical protein